MKFPKVLKIGGHYVTVKIVDKIDNADDMGMFEEFTNTITIKKMVPSQMESTLIHEVLHAMNTLMEHEKLEYLSQGLYQVIVDNKLVFDGKEPE